MSTTTTPQMDEIERVCQEMKQPHLAPIFKQNNLVSTRDILSLTDTQMNKLAFNKNEQDAIRNFKLQYLQQGLLHHASTPAPDTTSLNVPKCAECKEAGEDKDATVFCSKCESYYCDECDKELHSLKAKKTHIRVPIKDAPQQLAKNMSNEFKLEIVDSFNSSSPLPESVEPEGLIFDDEEPSTGLVREYLNKKQISSIDDIDVNDMCKELNAQQESASNITQSIKQFTTVLHRLAKVFQSDESKVTPLALDLGSIKMHEKLKAGDSMSLVFVYKSKEELALVPQRLFPNGSIHVCLKVGTAIFAWTPHSIVTVLDMHHVNVQNLFVYPKTISHEQIQSLIFYVLNYNLDKKYSSSGCNNMHFTESALSLLDISLSDPSFAYAEFMTLLKQDESFGVPHHINMATQIRSDFSSAAALRSYVEENRISVQDDWNRMCAYDLVLSQLDKSQNHNPLILERKRQEVNSTISIDVEPFGNVAKTLECMHNIQLPKTSKQYPQETSVRFLLFMKPTISHAKSTHQAMSNLTSLHHLSFYSGLQIGKFACLWSPEGIAIVTDISKFSPFAVFEIGSHSYITKQYLQEYLEKIAHLIVQWNVLYVYNSLVRNSQHFVEEVLNIINLKDADIDKQVMDYLDHLRKDPSKYAIPNCYDRATNQRKFFYSHAELDDYSEKVGANKSKHELFTLLKGFDRGFWYTWKSTKMDAFAENLSKVCPFGAPTM